MLGFFLQAAVALAQPQPGDIYREYNWNPDSYWQRVTGPSLHPGPLQFLPNPVNSLVIDDFEHATRAEMSIEMLQVHAGTIGHAVQFNSSGSWLTIPESPHIPGNAGTGPNSTEYLAMRYPVVPLPLDALVDGPNTFEFTAQCGTLLGSWWPQWITYGATVRVYYDDQTKEHPTGQITSHVSGATLGEDEVFQASASSSVPIEQVDFVGRYTDYNWEGDGNYRQWHDRTFRSELHNHIGTDTDGPGSYEVTWDNDWVPDQDEPMEVTARIVDESGLTYITPAVTGLELERPFSVQMYKPYEVPREWSSRMGWTYSAKVDVLDDLSEATAAQMTMSTWNGVAADEIGLNGTQVVENVGYEHNLSYNSFDVPLNLIQQGTNTVYTYSDTTHHGIDVLWPGPVLMVRSDPIPEPSTLVLLGLSLVGLSSYRRLPR